MMSSSVRPCGCRDVVSDQVLIVGTCPECLPVGSIYHMIENGRQLELFGEGRVRASVRAMSVNTDSKHQLDVTDRSHPENGLPF